MPPPLPQPPPTQQLFYRPLASACILPLDDLAAIFSCVEDVYAANVRLLSNLEARCRADSSSSVPRCCGAPRVSDVFLDSVSTPPPP